MFIIVGDCYYFSENNPGSLRIQYGVLNIKSTENIVKVKNVIRHKNYTPGFGYPYDVAVLEVGFEINKNLFLIYY